MRGPDLPLRSQLRHPLRSASAATGFASPRSATAMSLPPRAKYEGIDNIRIGGPPFGGDAATPPAAHAHARGRGDGTLKWLVGQGVHDPHYTRAKYDRDDSLGDVEACAPRSFARYQRHKPRPSASAARA
jgi:hypothetical protein